MRTSRCPAPVIPIARPGTPVGSSRESSRTSVTTRPSGRPARASPRTIAGTPRRDLRVRHANRGPRRLCVPDARCGPPRSWRPLYTPRGYNLPPLSALCIAMSHPLNTPLGRFGIVTSQDGPEGCVASIPAGEMFNPLTGTLPTAPLAMLVGHVGGLVNHRRRGPGEWTVSSELSFEVRPDAVDVIAEDPDVPVDATSKPFAAKSDVALGLCEISHRGVTLATATVRSFYISVPEHVAEFPDGPTGPLPPGSLSDRMSVRVAESGGATRALQQLPDPVL